MSTNIISIFKIMGAKNARMIVSRLKSLSKQAGAVEYLLGNEYHSNCRDFSRSKDVEFIQFKDTWTVCPSLFFFKLLEVRKPIRIEAENCHNLLVVLSTTQVVALRKVLKRKRFRKAWGNEARIFWNAVKDLLTSRPEIPACLVVGFECIGGSVTDEDLQTLARRNPATKKPRRSNRK